MYFSEQAFELGAFSPGNRHRLPFCIWFFCIGVELALFILFLCERRMSLFLLSLATRPDSAENDGTERHHHQLCHYCISTWVSFFIFICFYLGPREDDDQTDDISLV